MQSPSRCCGSFLEAKAEDALPTLHARGELPVENPATGTAQCAVTMAAARKEVAYVLLGLTSCCVDGGRGRHMLTSFALSDTAMVFT